MINETITGDGASAATNPTSATSVVIVEHSQHHEGSIWLQMKSSSGDWVSVAPISGAMTACTPDSSVSYRFKAVGIKENVRVYFGP